MSDDAHVDESLASVKNLCEFAYEHGYHEHGYDPFKVVADAIVALRARAEELEADKRATLSGAGSIIATLEAEVAVLRQAIMHMCACVKNGEGATVISYMEMFKEDPGVADAITTVQIVLAGTSG